jgi:hypothetical protein
MRRRRWGERGERGRPDVAIGLFSGGGLCIKMVTIAPSHLPMSVQPYERGETRGSIELANETCRGIGIGRSNGAGHMSRRRLFVVVCSLGRLGKRTNSSLSAISYHSARPVAARRRHGTAGGEELGERENERRRSRFPWALGYKVKTSPLRRLIIYKWYRRTESSSPSFCLNSPLHTT